jgi:hypothetical protein
MRSTSAAALSRQLLGHHSRPALVQVEFTQRPDPQQLSSAWTLSKGQRSAVCTIWSHEFGFEVRLVVSGDPLPRTEVCRTHEDLIARQQTWRAALEAKG